MDPFSTPPSVWARPPRFVDALRRGFAAMAASAADSLFPLAPPEDTQCWDGRDQEMLTLRQGIDSLQARVVDLERTVAYLRRRVEADASAVAVSGAAAAAAPSADDSRRTPLTGVGRNTHLPIEIPDICDDLGDALSDGAGNDDLTDGGDFCCIEDDGDEEEEVLYEEWPMLD